MPDRAIDYDEGASPIDSDVEDALWFSGRNWRDIKLEDWKDHMCAFTFMSAEAARYYLPSLLTVSAQNPEEWIYSLDSLMSELDHYPGIESWEDRFKERFLGFYLDEYEALKDWLLYMAEHAPGLGFHNSGAGETCLRALDVVNLLQQEVEIQNMIEREALGDVST